MNLDTLRADAHEVDEATFVARHPAPVFVVRKAVMPAPPRGDESPDWRVHTQRLPQVKLGPGAAESPFAHHQLGTVERLVKTDRNPFAGMITIGRAPNNDVCLPAVSVSKLHAYVLEEKGAWFLRDSGSANGTFVNGVRVEQGTAARLNDGAHIAFGNDAEVLFKTPAGLYQMLRKAKTP